MVATTERIEQPQETLRHHAPDGYGWRIMLWGLLLSAFGYLYADVIADLVTNWWQDPDYSHGFLVPVLSAYFVWQRRQCLVNVQPHWGGLGVLLLGLAVLSLGHLGAEFFFMRVSMIVVIAGMITYIFGWYSLRRLAFPVVFLLCMIPPPTIVLNLLTFPLQLLAAKASTFTLQLLQLPVYREGNVIFLPYVTLEVVEACSGIRSLMSLLTLAVVFAYLTQQHIWKRTALVISAIPIALIANACRIWGTGILSYFYGAEAAEGFYHTFTGWLVFVVAFGLLLIEGYVVSRLRLWSKHHKEGSQ